MKLKNVEITNIELDAIEDLATVWILCKKHRAIESKTDIEIYRIQQECDDCIKIGNMTRSRALHVWSKLVHAYNIAKNGKCYCKG